jgi:hypothetical protein
MLNRWLLAALALAVAALQAWDSHGLEAGAGSIAGIITAVLLPPIAIVVSRNAAVRLTAAATAVALLAVVRFLSLAHLPELVLAGGFPAVLILVDYLAETQRRAAKQTRESA